MKEEKETSGFSSFIFYDSFANAIAKLPDKDQLNAYKRIVDFALKKFEHPEKNDLSDVVFLMAKPQLEANQRKASGGGKGGRPKTVTLGSKKTKPKVTENNNHRLLKNKTIGCEKIKPNKNENKNVNKNENKNVNKNENKNVNENENKNVNENDLCEKFEIFYNAYNKKIGKEQAKKTWESFVKKQIINPENINLILEKSKTIGTINLQKKSSDDFRYVKHPTTWLNAHGWLDEIQDTGNNYVHASHQQSEYWAKQRLLQNKKEN